jgi:acetolactate synthase-1/2/3 large subunit
MQEMTGGEALVRTLLGSGISVCFANPGTSEMSFVAALDAHPDMRCILCLFEGGVTGAADGYARMTGEPAVTLLHLGPGYGNGWANLHNARKGHAPMVNVVGDHAGYHLKYDAPLQADLEGVVRSVSAWTRRIGTAEDVSRDTAAAIRAARSAGGQLTTLILPADVAWSDVGAAALEVAAAPPRPHRPDVARIEAAARALEAPGAALLLGAPALYGDLADLAGRISARTGCRLIAPLFAPRIARGAGAVDLQQMLYPIDENTAFLADVSRLVCLGEHPPVSFFAYPGRASTPQAPDCIVDELCFSDWDVGWSLRTLARAAGVEGTEPVARIALDLPSAPEAGPLTPDAVGRLLARHLPEGAIVVNEAVTAGFGIWPHVDHARAHDRINNTGGSIGQCLPNALGAAVACPDRPVIAVSGDGSAMYQLQSLWTAARESLDITVIILANRGYQILHRELAALGIADPGRNARRMFDIEEPELDWVALARGHGVRATRAATCDGFDEALADALGTRGPCLIEAVL